MLDVEVAFYQSLLLGWVPVLQALMLGRKILMLLVCMQNWIRKTSSIEYICTTAEHLASTNRKFDVVLALEVIEHVADPLDFCQSLSALVAPGGATVISTVNRSMRAYATAIVVAEYLLNWLPRGTHQWSKFLTPEELVLVLQRASISVEEMAGFVYNPLTGVWSLSDDTSVNFIVFGTKEISKSA
ncbi:hypothetical protein HPP92_000565 [Vanilla planifolia]|uniref:3-demethylubiquinol 3-O-methyltransferase n=1 Tax=Vanilla planifolia TaxID=51239 RepID=A0A835RQ53_VANPL|nr:hypothetical protein HPP92_000565 [Vanilla planifolia]